MTVAELRKQSKLSQSQFAALFDIPVRTIQQWEQGKSAPPAYVVVMMEKLLPQALRKRSRHGRHSIPERRRWRVVIDDPFDQCECVHPLQQRKVRELIDDIAADPSVRAITIFGSSVTERCHQGSDVDLYVEMAAEGNPVSRVHGFPFDLWTNFTADDRLRAEIEKKGVRVYG